MDDTDAYFGYSENVNMWRSNGCTFILPGDQTANIMPQYYPDSGQNFYKADARLYMVWRLVPEFTNTLFYQYDGINSIAAREVQSEDVDANGNPAVGHYLPNQVHTAIPANIGFNIAPFEDTCFTASYIATAGCSRDVMSGYAMAGSAGACAWFWTGEP